MSKNQTILIVDDDPDVVRGIKLRFDAAGYETIVADSAAAGIMQARASSPDAIVMDVRLKEGNGMEAVEELKQDQNTKGIPIVMLSACVGMQQQALDLGARFFLRKPFKGREVITAVESAINESNKHLLSMKK